MAYEHARLRREILAELIGQNLIDAAEIGEVTIEQVDNIPGQSHGHSHEHGHEHSHDEPAHKHPPRGRPLPPAGPQAPPRKSISNRRRYY